MLNVFGIVWAYTHPQHGVGPFYPLHDLVMWGVSDMVYEPCLYTESLSQGYLC